MKIPCKIALLFFLMLTSVSFAQTPVQPILPTLPQRFVNVTMPNTAGYTNVTVTDTGNPVTNAQNFQQAVSTASCNPQGTIIYLVAGANYDTAGTITLPAKNCASGKWIIIRSDAPDSSLPPEGVRITPSYASLLPKIRRITNINGATIHVDAGATNYRIMFVEVTSTVQGLYNSLRHIEFGDSTASTMAQMVRNLIADRLYIHGSDSLKTVTRRGVELACGDCAVINSYISEIHDDDSDTQAVGGYNTDGPILIDNNFLSAGSENIMIGGARSVFAETTGLNPHDITITRNHIFKPQSWNQNDPSYAGQLWFTKNLLELKTGVRVLIEGNVLENCFAGAQVCAAFNLKTSSSGINNPVYTTSDVTIRYNKIIRAEGGMMALSAAEGGLGTPMARIHASDNIFDQQGAGTYGGANGGWYLIAGGPVVAPYFEHNTVIIAPPNPGQGWIFDSDVTYPPDVPFPGGIALHNNIFAANGGTKQSCSVNGGPENYMNCFDDPPGTLNGEDSWHKNLVYNADPALSYPTCNPNRWQSTTSPWAKNRVACVSTISGVGFIDVTNKDYHLAASSPGHLAATDGKDVGADIDLVNQMTAGAVSGIWSGNYTPPPPPADTTPPVISGGSPLGTLSAGTTSTTLGVSTNEAATCKYSTNAGVAYASMPSTFTTTGSYSHSAAISVSGGQSYTYYVRCQDTSSNLNQNTNDYTITFSVNSINNFGRPSSDVTTGWLGTAVPHWSNLDEVIASDTDLIRTGNSAGVQTDEVKLSPVLTPSVNTGHILRVRAGTDGCSNTLTYSLVQGTNVIASASHSLTACPSGFANDSFTLTTSQASQITDYSDLRVRLTGNAISGRVWVSWIEFEVPAGGPSPTCGSTPANTCILGNPPSYCSSSGTIVNNCQSCGCPGSQQCNSTTSTCYTQGFSGLILNGRITRTTSGTPCASCTIDISLAGQTGSATTNAAGDFSIVLTNSVAPGQYIADIGINDGVMQQSFKRRVTV